jgi:excisionase family DNA binding protein
MTIPRRFTDQEAADLLGVHVDTVRRERWRGKLGFTRFGRRVFITEHHIARYLTEQEVEPCRSDDDKARSGSASDPAPTSGTQRGSTPVLDRRGAAALARATFARPKSNLRDSSLSDRAPETSTPKMLPSPRS